jgi:hypothetical protein
LYLVIYDKTEEIKIQDKSFINRIKRPDSLEVLEELATKEFATLVFFCDAMLTKKKVLSLLTERQKME